MHFFPILSQTWTVVAHAEPEHAIGTNSGNPNCTSLNAFRDAMFDCILHHGLQDQAWNLSREKFLGDIHAELKAFGKSHFLNVEISLGELQLLPQRNLLPI